MPKRRRTTSTVGELVLLNRKRRPRHHQVDTCAAHIIAGACRGELKPAQRLGEASLARKLGIGQAHVRAAFDRLAHSGILDRKWRSGTYLRQMSVAELIEMTQVRALLEGFACRQAARNATEADLRQLEASARDFDRQIQNLTPDEYGKLEALDLTFHKKIVELSKNAVVKRILDDQHLILSCLRGGFGLPGIFAGKRNDAPNHLAIVQFLRARDSAGADQCMRRHLMDCLVSELRLTEAADLT